MRIKQHNNNNNISDDDSGRRGFVERDEMKFSINVFFFLLVPSHSLFTTSSDGIEKPCANNNNNSNKLGMGFALKSG